LGLKRKPEMKKKPMTAPSIQLTAESRLWLVAGEYLVDAMCCRMTARARIWRRMSITKFIGYLFKKY
jgi:hypothetical protein